MFLPIEELYHKLSIFCKANNLGLEKCLGQGIQGIVYSTNINSALKIHTSEEAYNREKLSYLRLKERNINKIRNFVIPRYKSSNDELLILEISIVTPPFILDFGSAYIDQEPEVLATQISNLDREDLSE